jgi:hypothetical protein
MRSGPERFRRCVGLPSRLRQLRDVDGNVPRLIASKPTRPISLWAGHGPCVQIVGRVEGVQHLKVGTFATLMERELVLLVVLPICQSSVRGT